MPMPDGPMLASFLSENEDVIVAVGTVLLAFAVAEVVDKILKGRAVQIGERVAGGRLSPVADTRLRLIRRLVFATIIVLGIGFALWKFDSVRNVATGVLASSALLGLIVGFAARQTLANTIAGISLVISQPVRVGDLVTFEEQTGEVEDIRLSYTSIRCDDGRRLIVPNERLAQSSIVNHTVVDPRVRVEVDVWLPSDGDADEALELLTTDDVDARVAEITSDGIRLVAATDAASPHERGRVAAKLRQDSLRKLRTKALS
jgi:small-conductance mechanosensitive channel